MRTATFRQVPAHSWDADIEKSIAFYIDRLGFALKFRDGSSPTNYVGFLRDRVELHMQFQYPHEMGTVRLRISWTIPTRFARNIETKTSSPTNPPITSPGARENSPSTTPTAMP